VLAGIDTAEDAGVYKLSDTLALVQTADFITPVVDDPFVFGKIAVANALSDIYAMGAKPVTAINLVMFDTCRVPEDYLKRILEGGVSKLKEAGVVLVGRHTVDDVETKYGLAVTGVVHPERLVRNCSAKPGDVLIYTKPLGLGVMTTAIKADMATKEEVAVAGGVMSELNRRACQAMLEVGVNACTDVTGFGFLGHLYEMVVHSGVGAVVFTENLRFVPGARKYAEMGLFPAVTYENVDYASACVSFSPDVDEATRMLLFDPQTSGGLLIAVEERKAPSLLERLRKGGVHWAFEAGKITSGSSIEVLRRE